MMPCPQCKGKTGVIDTSYTETKGRTRRRRCCTSCSHKFTTYEMTQMDFDEKSKQEAKRITAYTLSKTLENF